MRPFEKKSLKANVLSSVTDVTHKTKKNNPWIVKLMKIYSSIK